MLNHPCSDCEVGVNDEPFLLPHLFEGICDIKGADFFVILEFEEFVSAVTSHVNEDVGPVVCQETF